MHAWPGRGETMDSGTKATREKRLPETGKSGRGKRKNSCRFPKKATGVFTSCAARGRHKSSALFPYPGLKSQALMIFRRSFFRK